MRGIYDPYGAIARPLTQAERDAAIERVRVQDEARERQSRAWNRFCGALSPIGNAVEL